MKNKIIVIDLDGTLLNDEKNISNKDCNCLIELSVNNNIILASGRNYIDTMKIVRTYNLQKYIEKFIICSNGQQIYDISKSEVIISNYIEKTEVIDIINMLDKEKIYWYIINNKNLYCLYISYNCNKYIDNSKYKINILKNKEYVKEIEIEKFILNTENVASMEKVKKQLCAKYKVDFFKENRHKKYKGMEYFQNNILPKDINKYTALKFIIKQLNLSRDIIAFGDGINDYELMINANMSICMQNGNHFIKKISNHITLSNNENGFSYAISHLIKQ